MTRAESQSVLVENLGGIERWETPLEGDVTVVTGPNASNKTSFLRAVAAALGGSAARLKADADEGRVSLTVEGETYERRFVRKGEAVVTSGDPYTDDEELVDLFVTLLSDNPLRRSVERGQDLRDLLMAPVDEAAIRDEIDEAMSERSRIRDRLNELSTMAERLPELERRREELESRRSEVVEEITDLEDRIEDLEVAGNRPEVQSYSEDLDETRRDRNELRERIDRERGSLSALRDQRAEVEAELADFDDSDENEAELEAELERLTERSRQLEELISELSTVVNFNRKVIDDRVIDFGSAEGSVVDALDPSTETIDCWTCGTSVERRSVTNRTDELQSILTEQRETRSELDDRIQSLRERRQRLEQARERRDRLEGRLDEIEIQIERRESRVAELREREAELEDEIDELESRLSELGTETEEKLMELKERLTDLEYERGQIERELGDVEDEIARIERDLEERDRLSEQESELEDRLASLRSRIEDSERAVVQSFNENAAELLDLLEYGNLERVRLDRIVEERPRGRATDGDQSHFELRIARSSADGSIIEDDAETLSESEREVVGLAVALAGYVTHDVGETVPMLLVDSLDAIDTDRIEPLIRYISSQVPHLLIGMLPDDAASLDEEFDVVRTRDQAGPGEVTPAGSDAND